MNRNQKAADLSLTRWVRWVEDYANLAIGPRQYAEGEWLTAYALRAIDEGGTLNV